MKKTQLFWSWDIQQTLRFALYVFVYSTFKSRDLKETSNSLKKNLPKTGRKKEILLYCLKTIYFLSIYLIRWERENEYKRKRKISSKPLWIKTETEIQGHYFNIGNLSSTNVHYFSSIAFFHPLTPFNRQD